MKILVDRKGVLEYIKGHATGQMRRTKGRRGELGQRSLIK
jgi:hypothetical protein